MEQRQNPPQSTAKSSFIQIRPVQQVQQQHHIQPGTVQFQIPSPQRAIRPARTKGSKIQMLPAVSIPQQNQFLNLNGQKVVQVNATPQNQRLVFLQPVGNANGQITYIQKSMPGPHSPALVQTIQRPHTSYHAHNQAPVKLESTMSDEYRDAKAFSTPKPMSISPIHVQTTPYVLPTTMPVSQAITQNEDPRPPQAAQGSRGCSCSKSKCLKLYCECFRRGEYCQGTCACTMCQNKEQYNDLRQKAIRSALDRNEDAFKPKVAKSGKQVNNKGKHLRGCNCKRSGCLKKYCECYQAGVACYDSCNCIGCKNREDHDPLKDFGAPSSKRQRLGVSRILQSTLTPSVVSAAANCMIASGRSKPSDPIAAEKAVLIQFGRSLKEIIGFTINQQRESSRKQLN